MNKLKKRLKQSLQKRKARVQAVESAYLTPALEVMCCNIVMRLVGRQWLLHETSFHMREYLRCGQCGRLQVVGVSKGHHRYREMQ